MKFDHRRSIASGVGFLGGDALAKKYKSGTGGPLHTKEPVTVASFRTWRGWRENVARNRCLTLHISKRQEKPESQPQSRISSTHE